MHDLPRLARAEHLPDLSPSTYPGARALRRVRLAAATRLCHWSGRPYSTLVRLLPAAAP